MLLQPEWDRSCTDCKAWVYQDDDATPAGRKGLPVIFAGQRMPRPKHGPTPCYKCPKVPAAVKEAKNSESKQVVPEDANEPDGWHRSVVETVLECHAVGHYPDTAWLRKWAAIVRPYILAMENHPTRELVGLLTLQLAMKR